MGNEFFKQPRQSDSKYNKKMILYFRNNKTMEDVHETIEYLRQYYQTHSTYTLSEFKEVFESFFDEFYDTVFKLLQNNNDPEGEVDVYETIALMCFVNGDDFERRLDYIFRLFDFNQSDTLESNEFILTIQTAMKALCKVVCIKPPFPQELEYFATNLFNTADKNNDKNVSKQEFIDFCNSNWDLQDWFLKYADLNSLGNTDRRCKQKLDTYMKVFPGRTDIDKKNQKEYVKQEADKTIIEQLIRQQCPYIKNETLDLLLTMLEQTSQFLNPNCPKDCINYAAYQQVFKAWASFDACDINEDNQIDSTEMEFLLYALEGDRPDRFRIRRELEIMDTDKSGNINRKEWIEFLCIDPTNSGKMVFRSGLRDLFNKYDTNNSGELDQNELRSLLKENLSQYKSRWDSQQIQEIMHQNFESMSQEIIEDTINQLIRDLKIGYGETLVVKWPQFKKFMEKQMEEQEKMKDFLQKYSQ